MCINWVNKKRMTYLQKISIIVYISIFYPSRKSSVSFSQEARSALPSDFCCMSLKNVGKFKTFFFYFCLILSPYKIIKHASFTITQHGKCGKIRLYEKISIKCVNKQRVTYLQKIIFSFAPFYIILFYFKQRVLRLPACAPEKT